MMLIIGILIGFISAIFLVSCTVAISEYEVYMEGFNDGLKAGEENGRCKVDQDNN